MFSDSSGSQVCQWPEEDDESLLLFVDALFIKCVLKHAVVLSFRPFPNKWNTASILA